MSTRLEKVQVAAISAHNDQAIGELVADAMEKVGDEGRDHRRGVEDHGDRSWRSWRASSSIAATLALFRD